MSLSDADLLPESRFDEGVVASVVDLSTVSRLDDADVPTFGQEAEVRTMTGSGFEVGEFFRWGAGPTAFQALEGMGWQSRGQLSVPIGCVVRYLVEADGTLAVEVVVDAGAQAGRDRTLRFPPGTFDQRALDRLEATGRGVSFPLAS